MLCSSQELARQALFLNESIEFFKPDGKESAKQKLQKNVGNSLIVNELNAPRELTL